MTAPRVTVIGGGLAGSEAAWTLASRGVAVTLYEMRPHRMTPAHQTGLLAELVCSNSFKSSDVVTAHGLLKAELELAGSMVLAEARAARIPGGSALVVDRERFAQGVTERIRAHPGITVVSEEAGAIPAPGIVATGPLTSDRLAGALEARLGQGALAFYDAIAPIVSGESLDREIVYPASRYGKGEGDDYLNVPMDRDAYHAFVDAVASADPYAGHDFDAIPYFEGCLPIEEMARRGPDTLRFGPLKPVGLPDPRSGRLPYAVVQMRREDRAGQMWNLVGCQTRLRIPDQQRIFRALPGCADLEFLRYGSMHRNAYVNSPAVLEPWLKIPGQPTFLAGQLTGVEGYTESVATGWLAGWNLWRVLVGRAPEVPPATTMLGALCRYLRDADPTRFQPMNANAGLLAPLDRPVRKAERKAALAERALADFRAWWQAAA